MRGLREIWRVLKPGGRRVLATDVKDPPKVIANHGFNAYGQEQQADMLRTAGFSAVHFERHGRILYALATKA